jgi:two-component system, OmpR family, KDP operon response regulator KdpE
MKERVLFIDDDPDLLDLAQTWLRNAGYDACTAKDGSEGLKQLYCYRPDLVLLDIGMPRMDGWEVCRRIREMCELPIIMVSVNGQKSDLVKAFNLGVDDYVTKPIHFPELVARVQAVLRRHSADAKQDEKAVFHNEEIDLEWRSRQVWVRGQRVTLSPTEFRLLSCLIENRGWVVTHEELLRKVWGPNYLGDRNYVKLYVRYLREKIESEPSNPKWILTERGVGYRFAS